MSETNKADIKETKKKTKKAKKKYYSPVKEYDTFKRPHIFFKPIAALVKLFFPKNDFEWRTEKPKEGEPIVYICNHTQLYAPVYFIACHKEKTRVWANCYFLYFDQCWHHLKNRVLDTFKFGWMLYPLGLLLMPVIVLTFRAFNPIPVFHKGKEIFTVTFKKSVETLKEGKPLVIFPERTENKVNDYVWQFNTGYARIADIYYRETGKKIKFYPVYCAQTLHKFLVGDPIEYQPGVPIGKQKNDISKYLENAIAELGDSLPEHKHIIYG